MLSDLLPKTLAGPCYPVTRQLTPRGLDQSLLDSLSCPQVLGQPISPHTAHLLKTILLKRTSECVNQPSLIPQHVVCTDAQLVARHDVRKRPSPPSNPTPRSAQRAWDSDLSCDTGKPHACFPHQAWQTAGPLKLTVYALVGWALCDNVPQLASPLT